MNDSQVFLWAAGGSAAIEVVAMYHYYLSRSKLPARYQRLGFWVIRGLLCGLGGGLAVAHEVQTPLLAINIGASAPLILKALAQGMSVVVGSHTDDDSRSYVHEPSLARDTDAGT